MDQLIFVVCDLAVGVWSDRAAGVLGRIGWWVLGVTVLSTVAFLVLPWVAPQGSPALFVAITALWAATSAALRAPPLTLLGRYVAKPTVPWLVSLVLLGTGIASAIAPYLGLTLKGVDPRLPFALAGLSLAAITAGMVWAERALAQRRTADRAAGVKLPRRPPASLTRREAGRRSRLSARCHAGGGRRPGACQPGGRAAVPAPCARVDAADAVAGVLGRL